MSEIEKRKRKLLNLTSVENWTRNNHPRADETFFALSNFDKHPPRFGLGSVKALCAMFAEGRLSFSEAMEKASSLKHPAVRASAEQVLPAFSTYLDRKPIEGLTAFDGFRITYPIGPRPGGGTLAIPIVPTFVGLRRGQLVPIFIVPWANLTFDDFQKTLMSSIVKDSLLTHQQFIGCDAEIVAFPKFKHDDIKEDIRYECSWGVRSYAMLDREDLNRQFAVFGSALFTLIEEIEREA